MMARRLSLLGAFIVIVLALSVWRGQAPDGGRSALSGMAQPKRPETSLASPAAFPSRTLENLKAQTEALPSRDRKRVEVLDEILASKNDNDPRLDTEFRQMSPELKRSLETKYNTLAREKFNERGTLIFLLGREIKTAADLTFIQNVSKEPACLGMTDCKKADARGESAGVHEGHDGPEQLMHDRTLVYPQTVALKSMERLLGTPDVAPALRQETLRHLREMAHSEDKRISSVARDILQKFPN